MDDKDGVVVSVTMDELLTNKQVAYLYTTLDMDGLFYFWMKWSPIFELEFLTTHNEIYWN